MYYMPHSHLVLVKKLRLPFNRLPFVSPYVKLNDQSLTLRADAIVCSCQSGFRVIEFMSTILLNA
jgi:hypothetical protein